MQAGQTPDWLGQLGSLVGAGGLGMVLLKLIERVFARADKRDDDAVAYRGELRAEIRELNARIDVLSERLDAERERANRISAQIAEYRAESIQLRRRYHDLVNWISQQPGLPTPPPWLYERIPGPTERAAREHRAEEGQQHGDRGDE